MMLWVFRIWTSNWQTIKSPDDFAWMFESAEHAQPVLDKLETTLALFGTCIAPSKSKVLSQDWISVKPNLVLREEQLTTVSLCHEGW